MPLHAGFGSVVACLKARHPAQGKYCCHAGAFGLDGSLLTGRTLLNLDTEDWGEIFIGCAGEMQCLVCKAECCKL